MSNDIILVFFIAVVLVYVFLLYQNNNQKQAQYDQKINEIKIISQPVKPKVDPITVRDTAVVNDPLYPPIGRQPRPLADDYLDYKKAGLIGVSTRRDTDTYKLMGYLVSADKSEKWNLFGRQKYQGSMQGQFYAIQQCNGDQCTKIPIEKDMIVTGEFRDYYNLPSTVTFNSPLFKTDAYDVVQLKTELNYGPYY